MTTPALLWHTIRHLRPVQVTARARFRLTRPPIDERPAPPFRQPIGRWIEPARRHPSMAGPDSFRFLNREASLAAHGWDDPALPHLWRYNLHYFDDLAARPSPWHPTLIARWIAENPPGRGTGWEPYPLSLRTVNWIKWMLGGEPLDETARHSLAVQARWLRGRIEHHLLGNHLIANAKALLFLGAAFAGPEAETWLHAGAALLLRELGEQVLPDGGHCERSPMYHALVLEDLLDIFNLLRTFSLAPHVQAACHETIPPMLRWLGTMTHPDGGIAFFNDAAFAIAPDCRTLQSLAARLGIPTPESPATHHFLDSGYARLSAGPATLFLDMAPLGPDHLCGHGHADTLSFELSLGSARVLVNGGTGEYGTGPERHRQRGTKAHNTLALDGENSSETWSGFRTARRARIHDVSIEQSGDTLTAQATHDGYSRLQGRPLHTRRWTLNSRELLVEDRVAGPPRAQAIARFRFHPAVTFQTSGGEGTAYLAGRPILRWQVESGEAAIEPSLWHPEFGLSQPTQTLAVRALDNRAATRFIFAEALSCTSSS